MKKILKIAGLVFTMALLLASSIFGDSEGQWQYSKEITYDNKEDVKAIYLDEEVYSYAKRDLSDLRLINEKNEFVPYYIYNGFLGSSREEYVTYEGEEILSFMKDNDYYVDYEISPKKDNEDVMGNKLDIEVFKDSFYKEVKILGSYDNKAWETIKTDIIYNINGQSKTHINLDGDYKYLYYRVISLKDASAVPINHLTLIYDYIESTYEEHTKSKKIDHKIEINKEEKETVVKIHNKDRLRISNIRLKSSDDFNRKYTVYTATEEGERSQQITQGSIYKFKLEAFEAQDMTIPLRETIEQFIAPEYLQVVIQDRDDKPIDIKEIEIDYAIDKLVFKSSDPSGIQLLFGNELARKPDYDISSYITEMEKSKQETGKLLELVERKVEEVPEGTSFNFKLILNIAVVIISGLLVVVILKKK